MLKFGVQKAVICCWLLCLWAGVAQATVTIRITQGVDSPVKIAVVPFLGNTMGNVELSTVMSNNLSLSGRFHPLSTNRFPSLPSSEQAILFRDWRLLQQEFIAVGRMEQQANGSIRATMELFDVFTGQRVMAPSTLQVGSVDEMRDLAHAFSDIIYQQITGTRGMFSTKLAYVVKESQGQREEYRIEVSDWDGARSRVLFRSPQPVLSPSWSADGRRLAFVNFNSIGLTLIRELTVANAQVRDLVTLPGINTGPAYSPNGRELAFVSSHEGAANIYVMNLSNNRVRAVTNHSAIDTEPAWTADSANIIFTSDRGGSPQLYIVGSTGGQAQRITFNGTYNGRPQLSSDGRYVIFVHVNSGNFNIAAMDLQSRDMRILTRADFDESPSLAPNGSMLVYSTRQQGTGVLAWVSVDGLVRSSMPGIRGDVREPAWSPFLSP